MTSSIRTRASRILLALYLVWVYANVYILLLGGAIAEGVFHCSGAFYPYTYHGGQGLHLDWTMVREYDCVEFYLYVLGPLMLYVVGRLVFAKPQYSSAHLCEICGRPANTSLDKCP